MNEASPERKWAIISSAVIHFLLGVFFLLFHINLNTELPPEFVELSLANAYTIPSERYSPPPPPVKTNPPPASVTTKKKQENQAREVVKLPQRRMLEQEKAEITPPPKERVYVEENPSRLGNQREEFSREPQREEIKPNPQERYIGKREDVQGPTTAVGDRPSPSQQSSQYGEGLAPAQSYSIEWSGGNREKISGDLPQFPEGVNKSATIRIRFFVLPNGSIGQMIPMQKGDATFESISLKALKTWRFNTLESNAPQIPQQGVVTFIFKIE